MNVRLAVCLGTLGLGAALAPAAFAAPFTTAERTIQDCDGDNMLEFSPGERHTFIGTAEEDDDSCDQDESGRPYRLPNDHSIINFLQLSDFQMVDEESPARVEFLDTTQRGPFSPFSAAYRPQESLTTQVTEAMVRQARNTVSPVTGETLDLSILTGDNADSQQYNETRWFIDILDGTADHRPPEFEDKVDPNSGIPTETDPVTGLPTEACDGTPGTIYDGVRGGGKFGYYEPDRSEGQEDGDGYSPHREENFGETGRDVTVRDFPGLFEAANQPFESVGLDMPWYSAFGNHDALAQGNSPEAYFGPGGATDPPPPEERFNPVYHAIATGCVKPSNLPQPIASALEELLDSDPSPAQLEEFAEGVREEMAAFLADPGEGAAATTQAVPPDPRRCFLAKDLPTPGPPLSPCEESSWIGEHFHTTGLPVGHGFERRPPQAITNHDGYYSFFPRAGLRFIVLDTVTDECGSEFCSEGSVDDPQFRWLEDEFEAARAGGEYVLVFSHHTLRTTRQPFTVRDVAEEPIHYGQRVDRQNVANPQNATIGDSLEELYCRNTDVLLGHIAGHEHENYVERRDCLANEVLEGAPELFWHVSTAAHIDWPQQSRMIELVTDGEGQLQLVLTMLDHAGPAYPGAPRPGEMTRGDAGEQVLRLAAIAREIAYNDYQASRGARGERDERNVIIPLHRPWPYPTDLTE